MRSCGEDQLVVLAVAIAAYLNGLHGAFLDDDPIAILENNDVACPRGLRGLFDNTNDLWSHDFWGTPLSSEDSHLSFRPLTVLSFRLQHAMHGFHKVAYHAVNVGLHAGVCVLLHRSLGSPVLPRRSQRLLATLLFALHTVHVEVVTNVVGRAELLSATFFFAALLLHGRSSTRIHTGEVISAATLSSQWLFRDLLTETGRIYPAHERRLAACRCAQVHGLFGALLGHLAADCEQM